MQIVDISRPLRARIAGRYDCGVTQGDVQVFRVTVPGPEVVKDDPADARIEVAMPRASFP